MISQTQVKFIAGISGALASAIIITNLETMYWPVAGAIAIGAVLISESAFQKFLLKDSDGVQSLLALNGKVLPEILILLAVASTPQVPESVGLIAVGLLLYTDVLSLEMLYRSEMSHTRLFDHTTRVTILSFGLVASFFNVSILTWSVFVLIGLTLYEATRTNFKLASTG